MFAPTTPQKRKKRKIGRDDQIWTTSDVIRAVHEADGSPSRPTRIAPPPPQHERMPPIPINFSPPINLAGAAEPCSMPNLFSASDLGTSNVPNPGNLQQLSHQQHAHHASAYDSSSSSLSTPLAGSNCDDAHVKSASILSDVGITSLPLTDDVRPVKARSPGKPARVRRAVEPRVPADVTSEEESEDSDNEEEEEAAREEPGPRRPKVNNTISPSERCADFMHGPAQAAYDTILEQHRPPDAEDTCTFCGLLGREPVALGLQTARYRCSNCFRTPHLCEDCVLLVHRLNPFHRLLQWDTKQRFWKKITSADLNLILYFGHDGKPCPMRRAEIQVRRLVVVHEHGVMKMKVGLCSCRPTRKRPEQRERRHGTSGDCDSRNTQPDGDFSPSERAKDNTMSDEPYQLLEMGLFPGSWTNPQTAFTDNVLRDFHLLTLQAHTTAHDYFMYLRRCTDNVAPHTVSDRYRQLNQTMREFAYLRACRRHGQRPSWNMVMGAVAVLCPACPQPGMNMRDGWEEREEEYEYVDQLGYGADGNFRPSMRKKPRDKEDVALIGAAAYSTDQRDTKVYLENVGEIENEESTCNQFAAFSGSYSGDVLGIIALTCRHELVLANSVIDMLQSEKPSFTDFSVLSAMQRYLVLRILKQSYDVACQYFVRFLLRMGGIEKFLHHLKTIKSAKLPKIHGSVGSFHVRMHKLDCQVKQNPQFLPGWGQTYGDQPEHIWSIANDDAKMTKEMTKGHRQDRQNDGFADINVRKVHAMPQTLNKKYREAVKQFNDAKKFLDNLEGKMNAADLEQWKQDEAEWLAKVVDIKNHKSLDNPFVPDVAEGESHEAIVEKLRTARTAAGDAAGVQMVGAIEGMIALEEERSEWIEHVRSFDNGKARQRANTKKQIEDFLVKAQLCHDTYNRYVTPHVTAACTAVQAAAQPAPRADPAERAHIVSSDVDEDMDDAAACDTGLPKTFPWRDPEDDRACGLTPASSSGVQYISEPLDEGEIFVNDMLELLEDVEILLPSQYHSKVRTHHALKEAVSIERRLREGQANDTLDDFRSIVTARVSLLELRKQGTGQKHGKNVRKMDANEKIAGEEVRQEYHRLRGILRALGMAEDDRTYRVITDEDASPYILTIEQRKPGARRRTPSWLWADFTFIDEQPDGPAKEYMKKKDEYPVDEPIVNASNKTKGIIHGDDPLSI